MYAALVQKRSAPSHFCNSIQFYSSPPPPYFSTYFWQTDALTLYFSVPSFLYLYISSMALNHFIQVPRFCFISYFHLVIFDSNATNNLLLFPFLQFPFSSLLFYCDHFLFFFIVCFLASFGGISSICRFFLAFFFIFLFAVPFEVFFA
jgi:hypothetical protein